MATTRFFLLWLVFCIAACAESADNFDHEHQAWNRLLENHVTWVDDGVASHVDYEAFLRNRAYLRDYLDSLAAVSKADFELWPRHRQLAFLINAYNAFTIQLILDNWPVDSIRDIGNWLQNPWKIEFFVLLGEPRHLDWIEHEVIRQPGRFNEPRIHFAVNCAATGCPALRTEAYVGEHLERQLEDQTRRFLSDETRNRYRNERFELSPIFKWYRDDFTRGWQGIDSLVVFLNPYTDLLGAPELPQGDDEDSALTIEFLDYDWSLNAKP